MSDKPKRLSRLKDGPWLALLLLLFYLGAYPLVGTFYDRSPVVVRAFASEIAWAFYPMGELEAALRGRTVVFDWHNEMPPQKHQRIQFGP